MPDDLTTLHDRLAHPELPCAYLLCPRPGDPRTLVCEWHTTQAQALAAGAPRAAAAEIADSRHAILTLDAAHDPRRQQAAQLAALAMVQANLDSDDHTVVQLMPVDYADAFHVISALVGLAAGLAGELDDGQIITRLRTDALAPDTEGDDA